MMVSMNCCVDGRRPNILILRWNSGMSGRGFRIRSRRSMAVFLTFQRANSLQDKHRTTGEFYQHNIPSLKKSHLTLLEVCRAFLTNYSFELHRQSWNHTNRTRRNKTIKTAQLKHILNVIKSQVSIMIPSYHLSIVWMSISFGSESHVLCSCNEVRIEKLRQRHKVGCWGMLLKKSDFWIDVGTGDATLTSSVFINAEATAPCAESEDSSR